LDCCSTHHKQHNTNVNDIVIAITQGKFLRYIHDPCVDVYKCANKLLQDWSAARVHKEQRLRENVKELLGVRWIKPPLGKYK